MLTGGLTVTVVDDDVVDELQPLAVTLTVATPEKPAAHVTVPVAPVPEIVFPVPVTVQTKLIALLAEAV